MPTEPYLFFPFWKIKFIEKYVKTSYKKGQSTNTIQFLDFKKDRSPMQFKLFELLK